MSSVTSLSTLTASTSTTSSDAYSGLTTDDFVKIMLTELSNQDPTDPQKTSDMIANIREIQDLEQTKQEQKRSDLNWAGDLIGRGVTVSQSLVTNDQYDALVDAGLNPDVGSSTVTGTVTSYSIVNGEVWLKIGENDYPIDNVQSLAQKETDPTTFADLAGNLLGRTVEYEDASGDLVSGTADGINSDGDGGYTISVDGAEVSISQLRSIQ